MRPRKSHKQDAKTKSETQDRQPVKKQPTQTEKWAATLIILGCVGATASAVFMYYHMDRWLIWGTFTTVIAFLIAVHLHWLNRSVKLACMAIGVVSLTGCLIWQYDLRDPDPSERPRVWLKSMHLDNLAPDHVPTLEFVFENVGQLPGADLVNQTTVFPANKRFRSEGDLPDIPATDDPARAFIPSGQSISKTMLLPSKAPINAEDIKMMTNDTFFLYV